MAIEKIVRDKSPLPDEPAKHQRKRGQKSFVIERRFTGVLPNNFLQKWYSDQQKWHVYRRYETKKDRDNAIATMRRRKHSEVRSYEYRTVND